jgi:hypothetical protein
VTSLRMCRRLRRKEGKLGRFRVWALPIRDLGFIIGIPVAIEVGMHLYELQEKASDAQIAAD